MTYFRPAGAGLRARRARFHTDHPPNDWQMQAAHQRAELMRAGGFAKMGAEMAAPPAIFARNPHGPEAQWWRRAMTGSTFMAFLAGT